MAVDFSIPRLSFTPGISAIRNPSKTSALKVSIFPRIRETLLLRKFNLGFPPARRSFKSFVRVEDSQPQVYNNKLGGKTGEKHSSNLKTLIDGYKEAVLNRDEETTSEIEAMIYILENEKIELDKKVAAFSEDITSQKEKYIHAQADFENFRKRFEKDRVRLTSITQKQLLESLLPVVDNFERAKQQIRPETGKGKKINTSYQSIYKQFVEILRSLRVSVVETVGKPFDPLLHEAIAREECQGFREGIIFKEIRRGFLLGDQLLRPAAVIVSGGLGHKKEPIPAKESEGQPTTAGLDGDSMSNG